MNPYIVAAATRSADVAFEALKWACDRQLRLAAVSAGDWGSFDPSKVEAVVLNRLRERSSESSAQRPIVELIRGAAAPVLVTSDDLSVLQGLAFRDDLDDRTRLRLLNHRAHVVRSVALARQPLDGADLSGGDKVKHQVAANPHLDDQMRHRMVMSSNVRLRRRVALNPNLSDEEVVRLAKDHETVAQVAGNKHVDLRFVWPHVRKSRAAGEVAANPGVGVVVDDLIELARSRWADVLAAVVLNDDAPDHARVAAFLARKDVRESVLFGFGYRQHWHRDPRGGVALPDVLVDALITKASDWRAVIPEPEDVDRGPGRFQRTWHDSLSVIPDRVFEHLVELYPAAGSVLRDRRNGPLADRDRAAAVTAGVGSDAMLVPVAFSVSEDWAGGYDDLVHTLEALQT